MIIQWSLQELNLHLLLAKQLLSLRAKAPCTFRGASRDRTGNLLDAIQTLSQLSYSPIQ